MKCMQSFSCILKENTYNFFTAPRFEAEFDGDFVMQVQDWYNSESNLLFTSFETGLYRYMDQNYGDINKECYENQNLYPDGSDLGPIPYQSGVINGRG